MDNLEVKDREKNSSRTQDAVHQRPKTIDFYEQNLAESSPVIPTPEHEDRTRLLEFENEEKGIIGGDINDEDIKLEECGENPEWFNEY